jgi:transposase
VAERRAAWRVQQLGLNPERLVFLDETWAKTNLTRPRGRSLRGTRLVATVPHGHWQTTTFLAGLRTTGLVAPLVINGAVNGEIFLAYVRQQLAPTLRAGDLVIMDNLSSHKRAGVREALEAVGATLLYLPPYSPDFNPIEMAFSKFKWLLKSIATRTVDDLWSACGQLLDRFTETECRNYIRHAGYRYT